MFKPSNIPLSFSELNISFSDRRGLILLIKFSEEPPSITISLTPSLSSKFFTLFIAFRTLLSLKLKRIPFREFKIKELNEETLGELFSYYILETIITGKLIDINPFDQPAVEQVKITTKKLLS